MSKAFQRLERVLSLEIQQGYKDKAVVGGIRQFATFWLDQAREEAVDDMDRILVEQTVEILQGYGRLPGSEKRAEVIRSLMDRIKARNERVEGAQPGTPARQPETPSREHQPAAPEPPQEKSPRQERAEEPARRERREPQEKREKRDESDDRRAKRDKREKRDEHEERGGKKRERSPKDESQSGRGESSKRASEPRSEQRKKIRPNPDPDALTRPVQEVKGVGDQTATKLAKLGAETIRDLLYLFPRRYDDYSTMKPIHRLEIGEQVTIIGTVWEVRARRTRTGQPMVQAVINDGSGSITVTWYNQPWLAQKLNSGSQIALSGKVEQFLGRAVMTSPDWEPVSEEMLRTGQIVPIYPLTEGLGPAKMRRLMQNAIEFGAPRLADPLPEAVARAQRLQSLNQALYDIHLPGSMEQLQAARERLTFDELFLLQLGMLRLRQEWQAEPGKAVADRPELLDRFLAALPYALTGAQQRVLGEISRDMATETPMTRLLQGDVGAGKTVVAAAAMILAVADGGQAALMAPTEILAEQHYLGLRELLESLGLSLRLLTGSTPAGEKATIYEEISAGTAQILIGTHALIQPDVRFRNLLLAVVDEQHRFGVDQRRALRDRTLDENAPTPHLLAMSATPIPRTLALSLYGDLELSVLDEMPPGRQEIRTRWLRPTERERAYNFIRRQVGEGRQAYIIYPLVEESDSIDEKAAVDEHAKLSREVFPNLNLGLLHGRLKSSEKEAVMRAFKEGETQVLISTSVVEVGVDVPNSTVMMIEGANRFGLAQLHQFRGRVGRGQHQSYCMLIADSGSIESEQRLSAMESTNDGFLLAEKDLELRGPGQFFGKRQSGLPELRLASLLDIRMLERAREEAQKIFAADPELAAPENAGLREKLDQFWAAANDSS
ncbi:MAG: ATP-dependent DNA helicase RecG [Anaerolineales bacterium]|nr:ATP-dependent DNA helicase RecG [Anaerolineales bacterium]